MSARPRPVTATIKPASMAPPTGVRTRSYSLSSGSSTASLVSVLDHDSYESLSDSDQENEQHLKQEEETTSARLEEIPEQNNKHDLSSWEDWLLKKAKLDRLKLEEEKERKKKIKEEEQKKKVEKELEKQKAEDKYKEWCEKKTHQINIQKKQEIRRSKTKEELEEEEKKNVSMKSKEKFDEWMQCKKKSDKEKKRQEKEKKEKEEQEKEERRKKCEQKFEDWCKEAQKRPKSAHSSLGYASGKLTGYYDKTALPAPSYYNPVPWQPIAVPPPPKIKKKKATTAKKWNPKKYL